VSRLTSEESGFKQSKWIPSAIGAAVMFCFGNEVITIVTTHVDGLACIFYLSFGAFASGIVF